MNQPLDLTITEARRPRRRAQRTAYLTLLVIAGGLLTGTIVAVIFL